jgi:hypothetical protein
VEADLLAAGLWPNQGMANVVVCAFEDRYPPQHKAERGLRCSNKKRLNKMNKNRYLHTYNRGRSAKIFF